LIKPSLLLEATSHTAMGIAVGLAFAFLATHITALGIATLINYSPTPDVVMIMFVGTCAITFGIGATLTGLAITLTENPDTTGREWPLRLVLAAAPLGRAPSVPHQSARGHAGCTIWIARSSLERVLFRGLKSPRFLESDFKK
jgi:hypothetical protein